MKIHITHKVWFNANWKDPLHPYMTFQNTRQENDVLRKLILTTHPLVQKGYCKHGFKGCTHNSKTSRRKWPFTNAPSFLCNGFLLWPCCDSLHAYFNKPHITLTSCKPTWATWKPNKTTFKLLIQRSIMPTCQYSQNVSRYHNKQII